MNQTTITSRLLGHSNEDLILIHDAAKNITAPPRNSIDDALTEILHGMLRGHLGTGGVYRFKDDGNGGVERVLLNRSALHHIWTRLAPHAANNDPVAALLTWTADQYRAKAEFREYISDPGAGTGLALPTTEIHAWILRPRSERERPPVEVRQQESLGTVDDSIAIDQMRRLLTEPGPKITLLAAAKKASALLPETKTKFESVCRRLVNKYKGLFANG